jgi:class 3 adenylate cyclase
LFADVRGSTSLAEGMNPSEFSKIISRFFGASSKILLKSGVRVDRLVGDQIISMCIPYYVGGNH